MKPLLECTSLEAAAQCYSPQAYAYLLCKNIKKNMLYFLVSVLCTACGSSGAPAEPEQDTALNVNTVTVNAGDTMIIDSGDSPFFVESQVTHQSPIANVSSQIPQIGAAIGENETEATAAPEVNEVAEVNALEAPIIEPEAVIEFEALQAELIELEGTCSNCSEYKGVRVSWPENPSVELVEGYRVLFVPESNLLAYSVVSDVPVARLEGNAPNAVFDLAADLKLSASEGGCFMIKAYRGSEESEASEAVCFSRS